MRPRLWQKLAAAFSAGMMAVAALTLYANYQRERDAIETRYRESAEALASTLTPILLETLLADEVIDPDNTRTTVREIGRVYGDLRAIEVRNDAGRPLELGGEWGTVPPQAYRLARPIVITPRTGAPRAIGRLEVAFDPARLAAARRNLLDHAVTLGVVSILIAVSFSVLVARGITVPLTALARGMKRLESDELEVRVEPATRDEVGELAAVFNQLVEGMRAKRELLRYVAKTAWEAAHRRAAGGAETSGETRRLTVLFSDIQGFTPMTQALPAPEVVARLNRYFDEMVRIVLRHGGTIDKFIGDAIMALFEGDPDGDAGATAGLAAAREMQERMQALRAAGRLDFHIRIGLNTGQVVLGDIGSLESRCDFTCVGSSVNVAQRFETTCPPDAVHLGEATYDRAEPKPPAALVVRRAGLKVKGVAEELTTYVFWPAGLPPP